MDDIRNIPEEGIGILELFGKNTLENLQKTISKVLGLGVITSDYKGNPLTEMTGFTPFCQCVRREEENHMLCRLSDTFGIAQSAATQSFCIYCCPCGLLEVAIPIVIEGRFLGGFLAGQVRCHDVPEYVMKFENLIEGKNIREKNTVLKQLYNNIPVYEFQKFADMAELIFVIVNLLAEKEMARAKNYKREQEELVKKLSAVEEEKQLLEEELMDLKGKMYQGRLLNMIMNISNLSVMEGAEKTNEMIVNLAGYVRNTLLQNQEMVFLTEELENIERFLTVYCLRDADNYCFSVRTKREMEMVRIPSNILIPYVEKIIYLTEMERDGFEIEIYAEYQGEYISITMKSVLDMRNERRKREGLILEYDFPQAVENTKKKMKNYFGKDYRVKEGRDDEGNLEICFLFPLHYRKRV